MSSVKASTTCSMTAKETSSSRNSRQSHFPMLPPNFVEISMPCRIRIDCETTLALPSMEFQLSCAWGVGGMGRGGVSARLCVCIVEQGEASLARRESSRESHFVSSLAILCG